MITLRLSPETHVHAVLSPISELIALLHAISEPEHHPEVAIPTSSALGAGWVQEFRAFSPLWSRYRCRIFFPLSAEEHHLTFEQQLEGIFTQPEEILIPLLAEGILGTGESPSLLTQIGQTQAAGAEFISLCQRRSTSRGELAEMLVTHSQILFERLSAFLAETYRQLFVREWSTQLQPVLRREVTQMRHRLATLGQVQGLASLTPTTTVSPDTQTVRFDKLQRLNIDMGNRDLILVPSVHIRSHLTVKNSPGLPVVVHYSVEEPRQLTLRELHQLLDSINTPNRMELLRHLLSEPITTSELAKRLHLTTPQISNELRVLRQTGLVESIRRGRFVYHRAETSAIQQLGQCILDTLMR